MHAFWLVLTYDLLEDRCIDDVIIKTFFLYIFFMLNHFPLYAWCANFLFLPHFDVICDLLLNRRTATSNLFVNYNKVYNKVLYESL